MKCQKCEKENGLELSHDFPKYLGGGDKDGRHYLCTNCHDKYERMILARCFCYVYSILVKYPKERKELISYMTFLKNEKDKMKQAKFWEIIKEVKQEFYGDDVISAI